jgi:hypothetical protein
MKADTLIIKIPPKPEHKRKWRDEMDVRLREDRLKARRWERKHKHDSQL